MSCDIDIAIGWVLNRPKCDFSSIWMFTIAYSIKYVCIIQSISNTYFKQLSSINIVLLFKLQVSRASMSLNMMGCSLPRGSVLRSLPIIGGKDADHGLPQGQVVSDMLGNLSQMIMGAGVKNTNHLEGGGVTGGELCYSGNVTKVTSFFAVTCVHVCACMHCKLCHGCSVVGGHSQSVFHWGVTPKYLVFFPPM